MGDLPENLPTLCIDHAQGRAHRDLGKEHGVEAIVVGNLAIDQRIGPQEVAQPFAWTNSCPAEEVATSGSQGMPRRSAGGSVNPLVMKRGLPLR